MAAACPFSLVDTITLDIYYLMASTFIYGLLYQALVQSGGGGVSPYRKFTLGSAHT